MPADPPPSLPAPAQLCCQCSWLSVKQHTCSLVPPGQARMLSPCCPILSSPSLNSLLLGHSNANSLKSQERNLSGLASPASSLTASSRNPRLSPPSLLFSSLKSLESHGTILQSSHLFWLWNIGSFKQSLFMASCGFKTFICLVTFIWMACNWSTSFLK